MTPMHPGFSVYLDLVRVAAALVVYLTHSQLIVENKVFLGAYGHSAVVVFFVLSGYVVAFVTDQKEKDWRTYAASRLSRVYSVVIPAIVITLVADAIGRAHDPELYKYPWDQFAVRTVAALAMLNEFWFIAITPFSNVPYWSIAYESWFYLVFAVITFAPAPWRWWLAGGLLLIVGPKIAILFPLWLAGVALYRWRSLQVQRLAVAVALVAVSWVGIIGLHLGGFFDHTYGLTKRLLGDWLFVQMAFSKFAIGDYVLAALVVANFAGMRRLAPLFEPLVHAMAKPVAAVAGVSFTLYLTHQPLLLMWATLLDIDRGAWSGWWAVAALVGLSVWLTAQITEKRRGALRKAIARVLRRIGRDPSARLPA
jgi:peptidoglycan/LPS O-acetylase OafA/YrhL